MKVVFSIDPFYSLPKIGGGLIRLINTKKYLGYEGIETALLDQWRTDLEQYDIFHQYGVTKFSLGLLNKIGGEKLKCVISPIFWMDFRRAYYQAANSLKRRMKNVIIYTVMRISPRLSYPLNMIRKGMLSADLLLPTSYVEAEQLIRYFNIPKNKIIVVHSGVERRFLDADPAFFINRFGVEDFILVAGHFCVRKSQLNFIRAMKGTDIPIVFIGSKVKVDEWYYDLCRREAGDNMLFLDNIDYSSPLLPSCYAAANTFVLPSMAETPGLAALEAGLSGTKVVITSYGCTKEYFKDYATYIRPNDIQGMRQDVLETYRMKKDAKLRDHILKNHLCEHMAKKTKDAYEHVMKKCGI
ncbi:MAG: glycosyltransferase family 4 protein [Candidatus Scalindua sp.]